MKSEQELFNEGQTSEFVDGYKQAYSEIQGSDRRYDLHDLILERHALQTGREGMKHFWLQRKEDISGTSGTGLVAEGVVFSNGWCALHWLTKYTSVAYYQSIAELEAIHGHNGATEVVWHCPVQHESGD